MNNTTYSSWNMNSDDFQNSSNNNLLTTASKYNGRAVSYTHLTLPTKRKV